MNVSSSGVGMASICAWAVEPAVADVREEEILIRRRGQDCDGISNSYTGS